MRVHNIAIIVVGFGVASASACGGRDAHSLDASPSDGSIDSSSYTSEQAYLKASNTAAGQAFGATAALSADGSTFVIGAYGESSSSVGIDGDEAGSLAPMSGAVYVFRRVGTTWMQEAYIKASNTDSSDYFGDSVSISSDGGTIAVGAEGEASSATGVDGDQSDNSAVSSGAVYVFTRSATTWTQQAYIKSSNTGSDDLFGASVAISADALTLVVGAPGEASATTGVNGDQADNAAPMSGAAYVFTYDNSTWAQQAYVKPSNTDAGDFFGGSVALSMDGSTLAVAASSEASAAMGVNGNQADNTAPFSGAVYTFTRSASTWLQQAYLKSSNTDSNDFFGSSVSLSPDGSTLAVGAPGEASTARGIDGDQGDNSAKGAGAVYLFSRLVTTWKQEHYLKASNTDAGDGFGTTVALSSDGTAIAVGAVGEASQATGIDGNETDDSDSQAGAVYIFAGSGSTLSQDHYVKAFNTDAMDFFGDSIAVSSDGATLAIGAVNEASDATGINGDQADNSDAHAGAGYVFAGL